jgi:hypothetical protein
VAASVAVAVPAPAHPGTAAFAPMRAAAIAAINTQTPSLRTPWLCRMALSRSAFHCSQSQSLRLSDKMLLDTNLVNLGVNGLLETRHTACQAATASRIVSDRAGGAFGW